MLPQYRWHQPRTRLKPCSFNLQHRQHRAETELQTFLVHHMILPEKNRYYKQLTRLKLSHLASRRFKKCPQPMISRHKPRSKPFTTLCEDRHKLYVLRDDNITFILVKRRIMRARARENEYNEDDERNLERLDDRIDEIGLRIQGDHGTQA